MKNRIFGWIKRYFLARARSPAGPFLSGFMVLSMPALLAFVVLTPTTKGDFDLLWHYVRVTLAVCGLGVVLGVINSIVVRLFISYHRGQVIHVLVRNDEVVASGNPLWVGAALRGARSRKTMCVIRYSLPPWEEKRVIQTYLNVFPIELVVAFDYPFNIGEVYTAFGKNFGNFDTWLKHVVRTTALGDAGVQKLLADSRPAADRLPELAEALESALKKEDFSEALHGNIRRPIEVGIGASVKFEI